MAEPKTRLELIASTVQVLSVVVGVVLSVFSFNHTRQKEADARRLEAEKPLAELRRTIYLETAKTAAIIANPADRPASDVVAAKRRFRELYVSELSMVETADVAAKMVDLGRRGGSRAEVPDIRTERRAERWRMRSGSLTTTARPRSSERSFGRDAAGGGGGGPAPSIFGRTSSHSIGRRIAAFGAGHVCADGPWRRQPDPAARGCSVDVAQRPAQVAQPMGLADDVGVQGDAHHQRLARRLLEHLVEIVDDHLREVLAVHRRTTIAGMSFSSCG